MQTCLGRWVLERFNVYYPFSGLTNNQSESFNATIKCLQRWKEVPVDTIVLALHHIQSFFDNERQRGLAGILFASMHYMYI